MAADSFKMLKYPRTPHIDGSRLQPGDEDLERIPFSAIKGRRLVVEEKVDGANSAVSFDADGGLLLQSRGHYLRGGYRERHFDLFKRWGTAQSAVLRDILGSRYIMFGEWVYAKHTVYYDALPHYFLEFDIFDRETGVFLDTAARRAMLKDAPVASVPVLGEGAYKTLDELLKLVGPSRYVTENRRDNLQAAAVKLGLDVESVFSETELSGMAEGLYIKIEENGRVVDRMKYVRAKFWQSVFQSESHWIDRPIIPNQLAVPMESLFE